MERSGGVIDDQDPFLGLAAFLVCDDTVHIRDELLYIYRSRIGFCDDILRDKLIDILQLIVVTYDEETWIVHQYVFFDK